MNKIGVSKEQESFLKEGAMKVTTKIGNIYYFIPYWYKETNNRSIYEEYSFDEIPEDLKEELNRVKSG